MVRPATLFFVQNVVYALPGRFASIMLKDYGLSESQLRLALSLPFFLSLFAMTPGSVIADGDAAGKRRVLQYLNLASCVSLLIFGYLSAQDVRVHFALLCLFFTVSRLAHSPTIPILDAYALGWLENRSMAESGLTGAGELESVLRRAKYGRERLWGTASTGLSCLFVGVAIDYIGYSVVYVCSLVTTCYLVYLLELTRTREYEVLGSIPLYNRGSLSSQESNRSRSSDLASSLRSELGDVDRVAHGSSVEAGSFQDAMMFLAFLLKDTRTAALMFATVCESVGRALTGNLVLLYFVRHLDASGTLCGAALAVTVVFEIPLWYWSEYLLRRFRGRTLMLAGMASYITHATFYTLIEERNSWWVLCVEPLHGVTYGLVSMATVQEISNVTPPSLHATGQSFLGVCNVMGLVMGTMGGGYVMEKYNTVLAYRLAAGLVFFAACLYAFVTRARPSRLSVRKL